MENRPAELYTLLLARVRDVELVNKDLLSRLLVLEEQTMNHENRLLDIEEDEEGDNRAG
jgi:hypothetical protein